MKALAAMSGSALWRAESQRRRCKCPEKEIGCAGWRSSSRSLFRRAVSAFSLRGWRVPVMCMRGGTTPVVVTENSKILAYGGRSRIGDSTRMNEITLSGTYDDVYSGWTTGTGTDKADRNDSHNNKLIFAGGAAVNIYGGCTESDGGKAYGNTVFFIKTGAADPHAHVIYGGRTRGITSGEASRNTVTVNASGADAVWGGHSDSGAANGNVVNLNHVTVGAVIGGTGVITTNDNIVNMNSSHVDAAGRLPARAIR